MPALRFFAFATLCFVLPGGAFLWHQQLARLEREAVRTLRGPEVALVPGMEVTWTLELDANTEDQAWMDCQRQPELRLALPAGAVVRARARYLARGAFATRDAFIAVQASEAPPDGRGLVVERRGLGDVEDVRFGPLWLSYLQPLELTLTVVTAPEGAGTTVPVLAGEVSADYALAREIDRTVFIAFLCLGVLGVGLFALAQRVTGPDPRDRAGSA